MENQPIRNTSSFPTIVSVSPIVEASTTPAVVLPFLYTPKTSNTKPTGIQQRTKFNGKIVISKNKLNINGLSCVNQYNQTYHSYKSDTNNISSSISPTTIIGGLIRRGNKGLGAIPASNISMDTSSSRAESEVAQNDVASSQVCSARECDKSSERNPQLQFFEFPRNPWICSVWAENAGRHDLLEHRKYEKTEVSWAQRINKNNLLCQEHFEESDFTTSTKGKLYRDAIPTIFQFDTPQHTPESCRIAPIVIEPTKSVITTPVAQNTPTQLSVVSTTTPSSESLTIVLPQAQNVQDGPPTVVLKFVKPQGDVQTTPTPNIPVALGLPEEFTTQAFCESTSGEAEALDNTPAEGIPMHNSEGPERMSTPSTVQITDMRTVTDSSALHPKCAKEDMDMREMQLKYGIKTELLAEAESMSIPAVIDIKHEIQTNNSETVNEAVDNSSPFNLDIPLKQELNMETSAPENNKRRRSLRDRKSKSPQKTVQDSVVGVVGSTSNEPAKTCLSECTSSTETSKACNSTKNDMEENGHSSSDEELSTSATSKPTRQRKRSYIPSRRSERKRKSTSSLVGEAVIIDCPVCGQGINEYTLKSHLQYEINKLNKRRYIVQKTDETQPKDDKKKFKKSRPQSQGDENEDDTTSGGEDDEEEPQMTSEERREALKTIQQNRKRRRKVPNKLKEDEEVSCCPVCCEIIVGTQAVIADHVDSCLRQQEVTEEGNEEFEEYSWAGQTRVRVTTMTDVGFQGAIRVQHGDEDEDVDLSVDDSGDEEGGEFGKPQFSEIDIIPSTSDQPSENKERDALRKAVLRNTESPVPSSSACARQRWVTQDSIEDRLSPEPSTSQGSTWDTDSGVHEDRTPQDMEKSAQTIIDSLKVKLKEQANLIQKKEKIKCLICMEAFVHPLVSVQCWHVHCEECWLRTLGAKKWCPQCNMITSASHLRRIYL